MGKNTCTSHKHPLVIGTTFESHRSDALKDGLELREDDVTKTARIFYIPLYLIYN